MKSAYDEEALAPALDLMTKANPLLLGSGTYYLAEVATGLLVGCGGWTRERPGTKSVELGLAHVRHFAVHPDWTRCGIGRAIFTLCDRAARAAGVRAFECYSSLNAENFYRALSFVRIREMDMEFQPHVVLRGVLMRRNLYEE
jgi:GNAT superfamily N-acetyltransferase